ICESEDETIDIIIKHTGWPKLKVLGMQRTYGFCLMVQDVIPLAVSDIFI
ncbi:hypothetical protein L915_04686, partial [Phytophthora nicotianae]